MPSRRTLSNILMVTLLVVFGQPARACSVFVLKGTETPFIGRNYDWDTGKGMLVVNQRDLAKTAFGINNPMKWTAKYGSVTFNQYGKEFPCGGMNEQGLVIEVLWLDETEYAQPDARPTVSTLQWIQYQLDTASTIDDVLASDESIRVHTIAGIDVHFLAVDRSGAATSIEFLDGEMVSHRGDSLPALVLTNSTYKDSWKYFCEKYETVQAPASSNGASLDRFACAAQLARQFQVTDKPPEDYCFDVLKRVAQGGYTKWSIVYDVGERRIHFKTKAARQRRFVDLDDLDFGPSVESKFVDLDKDLAGDLAPKLKPLTVEDNRAVLNAAIRETPILSDLPGFLFENVARYPTTVQPAEIAPAAAR